MVLEAQSVDLKQTAIAKKKTGDTRGALLAMKQHKMKTDELAKLDGQLLILEKSKMNIESAKVDVGFVETMRVGKATMIAANKQVNVDDITNLKEELDEFMAENSER
jgi:hypothetical protein